MQDKKKDNCSGPGWAAAMNVRRAVNASAFPLGRGCRFTVRRFFFIPRNEAGGSLAAFSYAVRAVNVGGCSETEHMLKW